MCFDGDSQEGYCVECKGTCMCVCVQLSVHSSQMKRSTLTCLLSDLQTLLHLLRMLLRRRLFDEGTFLETFSVFQVETSPVSLEMVAAELDPFLPTVDVENHTEHHYHTRHTIRCAT